MEPQANTKDHRLLRQAIEKFAATTGVQITVVAFQHPIGRGKQLDALVDVETPTETKTYAIETKRHLTTTRLGLAAEQLKDAPYKGMLITDYVNPKMADRLKEMGLAFIDLAGNAYLNEPPIFVYIKGNRPPGKDQIGPNLKPVRAFHATGLKILFALLTNPELLQGTYRDIADDTDVALGTVGLVLNELRDHGHLYEKKGHGRRLTQKRKIIERWVTAYPEKLRPKLKLGRYRAPTHRWWHRVELNTYNAQWGGEIAAAKLTDYLIPEKTVIYMDKIPPRLLAENQLKVDPEGDVEILLRFWKPKPFAQDNGDFEFPMDIVPPLLIYADLLATADDRNIETARMIHEKFLNGYLKQD